MIPISFRYAGQVGYLIAGMKEVTEAQIGDTLYLHNQPVEPLPGFKSAKPMVFAGEAHIRKRWEAILTCTNRKCQGPLSNPCSWDVKLML